MFLPQRGRMSAQLTGEGDISSCFYLLVVIRHSPSSPASRELPPLGEAQRAVEGVGPPGGSGTPLPPPSGEVVPGCPQSGTGRGVMASELKPTKDPGGAGSDSGVSMDIRTAPPSLP